jgi:hypothetical protein
MTSQLAESGDSAQNHASKTVLAVSPANRKLSVVPEKSGFRNVPVQLPKTRFSYTTTPSWDLRWAGYFLFADKPDIAQRKRV